MKYTIDDFEVNFINNKGKLQLVNVLKNGVNYLRTLQLTRDQLGRINTEISTRYFTERNTGNNTSKETKEVSTVSKENSEDIPETPNIIKTSRNKRKIRKNRNK